MGMPDFPRVTGALNTAVANAAGSIVAIDVAEASSLAVSISGGAVAAVGAALVFEVSQDSSDGLNGKWHQTTAARTNANTAEAVVSAFGVAAGTALSHAWELTVVGWAWARVRMTALTSGDLAVSMTASRFAIDPAPVVSAHGVTNTPTPPALSAGVSVATGPAGTLLSNTACTVYELTVANLTGAAIAVKLYNRSTAPQVGTDVPLLTFVVDANSTPPPFQFGALGKRFGTGLGIAITGAAAATDTTAVAAGAQWSLSRA